MTMRGLGEEMLVIRNGTHRGKIVCRTYEGTPRYNIVTRNGEVFKDITEDELRNIPQIAATV